MIIYTIIKMAIDKEGNGRAFGTTEKAFKTMEQAQAYLKSVPIVWEESINGIECSCERAAHPVLLE